MFLNRLTLWGMIALTILAACVPQAGVGTEPLPPGIEGSAAPEENTLTAAASLEPSLMATQEPYIAPTGPSPTQELEPTPTLEPYPPPAPTGSPIDPDRHGAVSGEICNPDAELPAMTAYFEDIGSFKLTVQPILSDQTSYRLGLPPGQYIAYAYLNGPNAPGGLYSEAVRCGLTADCTDHNPAVFEVGAGQAVSGIDLCDWSDPDYVPPNPAPFDPRLTGMVYKLNDINYFRYDERGDAHPVIYAYAYLLLSPDGKRAVFRDDQQNDLFLVDFSSGEQTNLTNTPQIQETTYAWEPGLPETILFTALSEGEEAGPGSTGKLYAIDVDGSNPRILDGEHNAGIFAVSPDGQTIAYGAGETAYLYNWNNGVSEFDPHNYSPDLPDDLRISSPSWSPDGKVIAWHMRGSFSEQYQEGYGLFDLEAPTFQLIHPYPGNGYGDLPPAARWNPGGKWLAVSVRDPDPAQRGVWLVDADQPEEETFIGPSSLAPLWSPDGKWLVYHDSREEKNTHQAWLYNPEAGEHQETALPPGAWAVDW